LAAQRPASTGFRCTAGEVGIEDAVMKLSYLWRGLPGHPLHPPLTDVTIGAYTFALVAVILSKASVAEPAAARAWWLALVVALASSALTVLTGFLEWLKITRGTPLFRTATTHML